MFQNFFGATSGQTQLQRALCTELRGMHANVCHHCVHACSGDSCIKLNINSQTLTIFRLTKILRTSPTLKPIGGSRFAAVTDICLNHKLIAAIPTTDINLSHIVRKKCAVSRCVGLCGGQSRHADFVSPKEANPYGLAR